MKKVELMDVHQYDKVFYTGKINPRILVCMTDQSIDVSTLQDAQRPLEKNHLQDIADYVSPRTKGMLPASVMIGTRDDRLELQQETAPDGTVRYFIFFPETPEEARQYENSIDIIDGQHRLFAFADKYRDAEMKDSTIYEVAFSLFITPDLRTRRQLFTVTNEKQKSVNPNLMLFLKRQLDMLNQVEMAYYPVVDSLNGEENSPLRGRIIMSAEKIAKGYKAKELIKILDKAKLSQFRVAGEALTVEGMVKVISTYLNAWEIFYGLDYQHPGKETMTKISGLRYILLLLPTFLDYSVSRREKFTKEFVLSVIQKLADCKGLAEGQTLFDRSLEFRGEGATVKMAADDATELKSYLADLDSEGFILYYRWGLTACCSNPIKVRICGVTHLFLW